MELSHDEFINKFYKLNNNGILTVENYVNAIMKDTKEDARYNKYTVIQSYESPLLIKFYNDYSESTEELPVNDFRLKIVDEYLHLLTTIIIIQMIVMIYPLMHLKHG